MELGHYIAGIAFLVITLAMGGATAWLTGRAIALAWRPVFWVAAAVLPLSCAVRFLHYALAHGPLLAPPHLAVDLCILLAVGIIGWQRTRAAQMVRQYPWLYQSSGPLGWRAKDGGS